MEYEKFMKHLNHEFKRSKKFVEETLGIKLTNIELHELKENVKFTQTIYLNDKEKFLKEFIIGTDKQSIIPYLEAAFIFMNKHYGTQFYRIVDLKKFRNRIRELGRNGELNYYPEVFKKMQDKMHHKFTIY